MMYEVHKDEQEAVRVILFFFHSLLLDRDVSWCV